MPINIIHIIYRPTLNNDIYKIKQLITLTSMPWVFKHYSYDSVFVLQLFPQK